MGFDHWCVSARALLPAADRRRRIDRDAIFGGVRQGLIRIRREDQNRRARPAERAGDFGVDPHEWRNDR
jgi:hypothetical protein